jgi:hypothetical protein
LKDGQLPFLAGRYRRNIELLQHFSFSDEVSKILQKSPYPKGGFSGRKERNINQVSIYKTIDDVP